MCLLKVLRDLQMLFTAVAHIDEGLSFETLLTLKVEESLIILVGTRRQNSIHNRTTADFVPENVNKK
jgi:hypothetical protein